MQNALDKSEVGDVILKMNIVVTFYYLRIQQTYIKYMITKDDAIEMFKNYLANKEAIRPAYTLVAMIESTIEFEYGWVFFHQGKEYLETRNVMDKLSDNFPVIINKYDSSMTLMGSAHPARTYLKMYIKKMKEAGKNS
jgi:hypothetical protein